MSDPVYPSVSVEPVDPTVRARALTIEQVREAVPMARSTVCELIRTGAIPSFKIGRRRYVRPADLDDWIDRKAAGSQGVSIDSGTPR